MVEFDVYPLASATLQEAFFFLTLLFCLFIYRYDVIKNQHTKINIPAVMGCFTLGPSIFPVPLEWFHCTLGGMCKQNKPLKGGRTVFDVVCLMSFRLGPPFPLFYMGRSLPFDLQQSL